MDFISIKRNFSLGLSKKNSKWNCKNSVLQLFLCWWFSINQEGRGSRHNLHRLKLGFIGHSFMMCFCISLLEEHSYMHTSQAFLSDLCIFSMCVFKPDWRTNVLLQFGHSIFFTLFCTLLFLAGKLKPFVSSADRFRALVFTDGCKRKLLFFLLNSWKFKH